jgi:predicted  nucleic acid-binding Zn-ribbon protein
MKSFKKFLTETPNKEADTLATKINDLREKIKKSSNDSEKATLKKEIDKLTKEREGILDRW